MRRAPVSRDIALTVLGDPVRRAVYELVATDGGDVSRAAVAGALKLSRPLAAFHLDKLAEAGLLLVSYRRLGDRTGPGAGRPAKLYRRSAADLDLQVPARRYDLAASLLAEAVDTAGAERELHASSRRAGRAAAQEVMGSQPPVTGAAATRRLLGALRRLGYEPYRSRDGIRMRNCPFHAVAEEYPPVICGMSHAFLDGVLEGCGSAELAATIDPRPGDCCVVIRRADL
jgi:predicted ArsR family transcriptional regulator